MAKYCEKCGTEITDNTKFCKTCGAPVSAPQPQTPVEKAPRKKHTGKIILAVVAVLLVLSAVVVVPKVKRKIELAKVPAYERPLKIQADAMNEDDYDYYWDAYPKQYVKAYKDGEADIQSGRTEERMKEQFDAVENVKYKVLEVEDDDDSIEGMEEYFEKKGWPKMKIKSMKRLYIDISCQYSDDIMDIEWAGKKDRFTDGYYVIKVGNKWYSLDGLDMNCASGLDW